MSLESPVLVVGYDGSATARAAFDYAVRRRGDAGELYVVYAYAPPADWLGWPSYNRILAESQEQGRSALAELAVATGVEFVSELLEAPPADAIARVAETRDADEIVVGSRGHGRVRGAIGSVSHDLLHRAHRPVVVIPPPQ